MKGSEILEIVDNNICKECYTTDDEEFKGKRCKNCIISKIKNDIKALDQADKFKWHDLRENPDDLPEEYSQCIVSTRTVNLTATYHGNGLWLLDYYDRTQTVPTNYFIAWKYDEPFESEEY